MATKPAPRRLKIAISKVDQNGTTNARFRLNADKIAEYSEVRKAKKHFPPVDLFTEDDELYWIGDGDHRIKGELESGGKTIDALVHKGGEEAARLFSVTSNHDHGLPRTAADKRKALEIVVALKRSQAWTDKRLADFCGVTERFARSVRDGKTLEIDRPVTARASTGSKPREKQARTTKRVGKDGKSYPAKRTRSKSGKPVAKERYLKESYQLFGKLVRALDNAYRIDGKKQTTPIEKETDAIGTKMAGIWSKKKA